MAFLCARNQQGQSTAQEMGISPLTQLLQHKGPRLGSCRHLTNQALGWITNGRKGLHLPNTHTYTPLPFRTTWEELPAPGKHQV